MDYWSKSRNFATPSLVDFLTKDAVLTYAPIRRRISQHVYRVTHQRQQSGMTLANRSVTELEQVVDELSSNGVTFERYDDPQLQTDERGDPHAGRR